MLHNVKLIDVNWWFSLLFFLFYSASIWIWFCYQQHNGWIENNEWFTALSMVFLSLVTFLSFSTVAAVISFRCLCHNVIEFFNLFYCVHMWKMRSSINDTILNYRFITNSSLSISLSITHATLSLSCSHLCLSVYLSHSVLILRCTVYSFQRWI